MFLFWPDLKDDLEKLLDRQAHGQTGYFYGYRISPINGQKQYHNGQDIPKPMGTPVRLPWDGYVMSARFDPKTADGGHGGGNSIIVRHPSKDVVMHSTGFCHLLSFSPDVLLNASANSDRVKDWIILPAGTVLGKVDTTGDATGPHLHWTCRRIISRVLQTVDPLPFLLEAVGIDIPWHKAG
jgi:Membrane proteins related to metalloendopeptidases